MKTSRSTFRAASTFIAAALAAFAPSAGSGGASARVPGAHQVTAPQGTSSARNAVQAQGGQAQGVNLAALSSGSGTHFYRGGGCPPKDWGMSPQCARMVRKNRLMSKGLSAQRI